MKIARFNPAGEKLWIKVDMQGLYFMIYTYQLWGVNNDPFPILTEPLRVNNNEIVTDDFYQIVNDFDPGQPLGSYHHRVADVSLDVIKLDGDHGFEVTVSVLQGTDPANGRLLANDTRTGKTGKTKSVKELNFFFRLLDETQSD